MVKITPNPPLACYTFNVKITPTEATTPASKFTGWIIVGFWYATLGSFFLFLAAIGIYLLSDSTKVIWQVRRAQTWATTPGIMLTLERSTQKIGKSANSPVIRASYQYTVAEQLYTNDRIRFGQDTNIGGDEGLRLIEKIEREYPVGNNITVYYDPSNPGESVLLPTYHVAWYTVFMGAICLAIALFILYIIVLTAQVARRMIKSRQKAHLGYENRV